MMLKVALLGVRQSVRTYLTHERHTLVDQKRFVIKILVGAHDVHVMRAYFVNALLENLD